MVSARKFNLIAFVKEEIIGSENTFHAWCVLAAVVAILGMGLILRSPKVSFHGITGSDEVKVNFERTVEIRRLHVIPGMKVRKGDLLMELDLDANEDPNHRYVFSEAEGVIGSVNYQKGERVSAFSPILTISPASPTLVKGYVHESLRADLKVGMHVKVSSITGSESGVEGKIMSLGSRFVEIPNRLNPIAHQAGWGREVVVQISPRNSLLLGEKVMISPADSFLRSFVARADNQPLAMEKPEMQETQPVRIAPSVAAVSRVEASGAVFLDDLKKYLVVSDDTNEAHAPYLFLMSEDGEFEEAPLVIPGLPKIKDLESVSTDGEYTYVLSSLWGHGQAHTKTGAIFARFHRHGIQLSDTQTIEFGSILRNLLTKSHDPEVLALVRKGIDHLEVEAHAEQGGDLYIGLKAPRTDDHGAIILKITDVNGLFAGAKNSRVEVWKILHFPGDQDDHRISDLMFLDDSIYLTTTRKKEPGGAFWALRKIEKDPKLVRSFSFERPEGVAYNSAKNEFMLVFDQAAAGSRYFTLAGPHSGAKE